MSTADNSQKEEQRPFPKHTILQKMGLHPLIAFAVVLVDVMLFGGTVVTTGAGWLISLPTGVLLGISTTLMQRGSYGDSLGTAVSKGIIVGLLTAIPTPLPSILTASSGVMGLLSLNKKEPKRIES